MFQITFFYFYGCELVCSLNVRGLGDRLKRWEMFNWLRKKNYSICMLQEVHGSEIKIPVWSAELRYHAPNDDDPSFFLNFFDHLNDF